MVITPSPPCLNTYSNIELLTMIVESFTLLFAHPSMIFATKGTTYNISYKMKCKCKKKSLI